MTTTDTSRKATLTFAQRTAVAALKEHGLWDQGWRFQFDNGRKRFGVCKYAPKIISLSRYLVVLNSEAATRDVVLHEVAHALAGHAAGHGAAWRREARRIGAKPERCHSETTVEGRWLGRCRDCGYEWRRHRLTARTRQGIHGTCQRALHGGAITWIDTGLKFA